MNHKKNIDSWLEYAGINWLVDKNSKPRFRPSVEQLINKMKRLSADHKNFGEAWHYVEEIEQLQSRIRDDTRSYPKEFPGMLLECGIAAYKMGNSRESVRLLTGAIALYIEDHDRAIARWLLGCVYWHLEDEIDALSTWENSVQDFSEQVRKIGKTSKEASWYVEQINIMQGAIKYAVDYKIPPAAPGVAKAKGKSAEKRKGSLIRSLPVLGTIPAGTPRSIIPSSSEFMEIDHVLLEDGEYYAESLLRGEKMINLSTGQCYFVLRVQGNSMNQSTAVSIENGNYVILREQSVAESGDIVAAEIIGVDNCATLKRFKKEEKGFFLIPESNDPEFRKPFYFERSFEKFDEGFYIRGVAVAVLKPL
jgi:SOS-response transcriptional repressor LexA